MRNGRRGVSATKAPTPWRVTTSPSARSAATASRTTVRLTPVRRDQLLLGRQPRAGRELAADDLGAQPLDQRMGEAARRGERSQGRRATALQVPGTSRRHACRLAASKLSYDMMTSMRAGRQQRNAPRDTIGRKPCGDEQCVRALSSAIAASQPVAHAALAQQKLVLKASDVHPAGYPTVVAVENIGKKLDAGDQRPAQRADVRRRCSSAARRRRSSRRRSAPSSSPASASARSGRWSTTSTCSTCRSCSATPRTCRR